MPPASFRLIVRSGPNPGSVFDLTKEVTVLGRDVSNDIVLGDAEVSRTHARLTRTPGGYVLEDLGSTNGSFVNGERLIAPRVLNPGDLIGFGETVSLTFDATSPEAAATVMGPAARPAPPSPKPKPAAPDATPVEPAVATPASPEAEAKPGSPRRWFLAGCGCLLILGVCGGVLWFMPASWWCLLLTPLTWFGYTFNC
jgi:predicted component of type VI protein secretion system